MINFKLQQLHFLFHCLVSLPFTPVIASKLTSPPILLRENAIYDDVKLITDEYTKLRKYFLNNFVSYGNATEELTSLKTKIVSCLLNKENSKPLRRLFKYNVILNNTKFENMFPIKAIENNDDYIFSAEDKYLSENVYKPLIMQKILIYTHLQNNEAMKTRLKATLFTFKYFNRTIARICKRNNSTDLISSFLLIKNIQVAIKDENERRSFEELIKNTILNIQNKKATMNDFKQIDTKYTALISLAAPPSSHDKVLEKNNSDASIALGLLVSRLKILYLFKCPSTITIEETLATFEDNILYTLLLSYPEISYLQDLINKSHIGNREEVKIKRLINCIQNDMLFMYDDGLAKCPSDQQVAAICKKYTPTKSNKNGVLQMIYSYTIEPIIKDPKEVTKLKFGVEESVINRERAWALSRLNDIEDDFSTDKECIRDTDNWDFRKTKYYFEVYKINLLMALRNEMEARKITTRKYIDSMSKLKRDEFYLLTKLQHLIFYGFDNRFEKKNYDIIKISNDYNMILRLVNIFLNESTDIETYRLTFLRYLNLTRISFCAKFKQICKILDIKGDFITKLNKISNKLENSGSLENWLIKLFKSYDVIIQYLFICLMLVDFVLFIVYTVKYTNNRRNKNY